MSPRRRGEWAFYPAPWLLAAPAVVFAALVDRWPLAVVAAALALVLARTVWRPRFDR